MAHRAREDLIFSLPFTRLIFDDVFSHFYLGWHAIRYPPYPKAPVLSIPRTHLVWLKTQSEKLSQIYVIITDGNLNILNEIFLDMTDQCNEYSQLVRFLHRNILVNRSSPICGGNVHIDRTNMTKQISSNQIFFPKRIKTRVDIDKISSIMNDYRYHKMTQVYGEVNCITCCQIK